jgi:hypothetical protein
MFATVKAWRLSNPTPRNCLIETLLSPFPNLVTPHFTDSDTPSRKIYQLWKLDSLNRHIEKRWDLSSFQLTVQLLSYSAWQQLESCWIVTIPRDYSCDEAL